jgi:hypothetical protein
MINADKNEHLDRIKELERIIDDGFVLTNARVNEEKRKLRKTRKALKIEKTKRANLEKRKIVRIANKFSKFVKKMKGTRA